MRKAFTSLGTFLLVIGLLALPASAKQTPEILPLLSQDNDGRAPTEGTTTVVRGRNGLTIKVVMPTPEPGSYMYPSGAANEGSPEAFSLWAFVFANPADCSGSSCSGLGDIVLSGGGVFNVAGHITGGGQLVLTGHISKNTKPFEPPAYTGQFNTITNPGTAEVHVAVAPHGTIDPALLPAQITTPIGTPAEWWVSIFK